MAEEKSDDQTAAAANIISDETGQYDARFLLWRMFCAENNIAVETLPSELDSEAQEKWEELKEKQLKTNDESKQ